MNRFRVPLRRVLSVAAAAATGLVGVLVMASPASAHSSRLDGVGRCDAATGKWAVDWTVTQVSPTSGNNVPHNLKFFNVTEQVKTTASSNVADADLPYTNTPKDNNVYPYPLPGPYKKTQLFDPATTEVILKLTGKWDNGFVESTERYKKVKFDGTCALNKPSVSVTSSPRCDGTVDVVLSNSSQAKASAHFTIDNLAAGTRDIAPGAPAATVPVPSGFGTIIVRERLLGKVAEIPWVTPDGCPPVEITSREDCRSLTIELNNPDGPALHYVVTSGNLTQSGDLGGGQSKVLAPIPATTGTTATVTIDGLAPQTVTWATQDVCSSPQLPKTGGSLTALVSVGGALTATGAGMIALLFLLRRRRSTAA